MKTYVLKAGQMYLDVDGNWSVDQKRAMRFEAPAASAMRIVRLKLALPYDGDLEAHYDKYAGL